jgi:hypothetical protein
MIDGTLYHWRFTFPLIPCFPVLSGHSSRKCLGGHQSLSLGDIVSFFFFKSFPLLWVNFCKGVSSCLHLSIPVFLQPTPRIILIFLCLSWLGLATVFMVCPWVFFQSSSFPVIFLAFCAQTSFWHVWAISIYYPRFGSVYYPCWALLWCCISDSVLVFSIISLKNVISVTCILLSCALVHIRVFTPYNSIFLKYTLHIVILHIISLSLFRNVPFIVW